MKSKKEGFLQVKRQLPTAESVDSRIQHFNEFVPNENRSLATEQATRCMDCGVPFCHQACPLGNLIPDFNQAVFENNWEKALKLLLATNNFPEFTGRICPAPCEGSCVLGINKPPVAIEFIEKSIIEYGYSQDLIKPEPPNTRSGKKVAIVGSGPAGLTAADQLNKAGHKVTVFEKEDKAGGLLRYGIPDFKLSKDIIDRKVKLMEAEGIRFIFDTEIGSDLSLSVIQSEYDAVLLAGGCSVARTIDIPGSKAQGVHLAMDFLTQQNKKVANKSYQPAIEISAKGKNVIVIGGGDTGSDCVGTSLRQGAKTVVQFEILAKPLEKRQTTNPWPEWPIILRTSSSQEEGGERKWSVLTKSILSDSNGHVSGLETVSVNWVNGKPIEEIGTEKTYKADLILLAMGFTHPQTEKLINHSAITLTDRQTIAATSFQTAEKGVFVAGDMRRGQSLVVWAIAEGREAALAVDTYLMGISKLQMADKTMYQLT